MMNRCLVIYFNGAVMLCLAVLLLLVVDLAPKYSTINFALLFPYLRSTPAVPDQRVTDAELRGIVSQINQVVTEEFCPKAISCKFEQRHLPPFIMFDRLSPHALKVARQLRKSTLLVVVYNGDKNYYTAPLVHALYSWLFADIRFCGPSANSSTFQAGVEMFWPSEIARSLSPFYLDFLRGNIPIMESIYPNSGESIYYCANLAVEAVRKTWPNVEITGVVQFHDDVIFNFWRLLFDEQFDLSKSFVMPLLTVYDMNTLKSCSGPELYYGSGSGIVDTTCDAKSPWSYFSYYYQRQVINLVKDITAQAQNASASVAVGCRGNLTAKTKGQDRVFGALADIFYVAHRDFPVILPVFELAFKHRVYQEIAVPFAFHGCMGNGSYNIINSNGYSKHFFVKTNSGGYYSRKSIFEVFDAGQYLFGHPLKLGSFVRYVLDRKNSTLPLNADEMHEFCLYCLLAQYGSSIMRLMESDENKN